MTEEQARAFAADWIDAWNSHDLDRVLAHYHPDFQMESPLIVTIANEPSGRLRGRDPVRAYWAKALARSPDLHFQLLGILVGANSLCLYYERTSTGRHACEYFEFDAAGKVVRAAAHYRIPS